MSIQKLIERVCVKCDSGLVYEELVGTDPMKPRTAMVCYRCGTQFPLSFKRESFEDRVANCA